MASFLSLSRRFLNNPRSNLSPLSYFSISSINPSNPISDHRTQNPNHPFTSSPSSDHHSTTVSRVLAEKPINPNNLSSFRTFSSSSSATTNILKKLLGFPSFSNPNGLSGEKPRDLSPRSDKPKQISTDVTALSNEMRQALDGIVKNVSDVFAALAVPDLVKLGCGAWICYTTQAAPLLFFKVAHQNIGTFAFTMSMAILLRRSVKPMVSVENVSELSKRLAVLGLVELGYGGLVYYATAQATPLFGTFALSAFSFSLAFLLRQAPKLVGLFRELEKQARLHFLTQRLGTAKTVNSILGNMRGFVFVYSLGLSSWLLYVLLSKFIWMKSW